MCHREEHHGILRTLKSLVSKILLTAFANCIMNDKISFSSFF